MLWNHDKRGQRQQVQMLTPPDSSGRVKPGKEAEATRIWEQASHLHINQEFQFNANPTAAGFTERRAAGGSTWPTLQMDTADLEKAALRLDEWRPRHNELLDGKQPYAERTRTHHRLRNTKHSHTGCHQT